MWPHTSKVLGVGINDAEDGLRVVLVSHGIEENDVVGRCHLQEVLQSGAEHHVKGLASHKDLGAHGGCGRVHALRVDERLIEIEDQVELPVVQLVLCIRRDELRMGG